MADKVKCDRCGCEIIKRKDLTRAELLITGYCICNGTGEQKAEVKGVELTYSEILNLLTICFAGQERIETIAKGMFHRVLEDRTALQTAHEKELAELEKNIFEAWGWLCKRSQTSTDKCYHTENKSMKCEIAECPVIKSALGGGM